MVIIDCYMLLMSGFDFVCLICQEECENGEELVVIIGFIVDVQLEEIECCIQVGMNECLIKFIGFDVFEECLLVLGFVVDELFVIIDVEFVVILMVFCFYDLDFLYVLIGGELMMFRWLFDELLISNCKDLEIFEGLV